MQGWVLSNRIAAQSGALFGLKQTPRADIHAEQRAEVNLGVFAERSLLLMEKEPRLSCVVTAGVLGEWAGTRMGVIFPKSYR